MKRWLPSMDTVKGLGFSLMVFLAADWAAHVLAGESHPLLRWTIRAVVVLAVAWITGWRPWVRM